MLQKSIENAKIISFILRLALLLLFAFSFFLDLFGTPVLLFPPAKLIVFLAALLAASFLIFFSKKLFAAYNTGYFRQIRDSLSIHSAGRIAFIFSCPHFDIFFTAFFAADFLIFVSGKFLSANGAG